jgi:hypothetical protein
VGAISDTDAELPHRLGPAITVGLAEQTSGGVRFAHSLVRDAVYASLDDQRRAMLHQRAAEVLERAATNDPVLAGEVAEHWLRSGHRTAGARWAARGDDRLAGRRAPAGRRPAHACAGDTRAAR